MKRFALAVGMVFLIFAVSIWAQTTAPKPAPELNKFDFAAGHWTYVGEYKAGPLGPGSKFTGEMTDKRILGGFFLQNHSTETGPMGVSQVIEIFGYDPAKKNYFSNEYHSDGTMISGGYVFNGNTFTYTGKFVAGGTPFMLKVAMTIGADLMSITGKGEISTDGNTWVPWLDVKYTKVPNPAPKK